MSKSINTAVSRTRFNRLALEGGWIILGQVITILGSLALVRVLTERLNPEQYGQLALGLTVAGLVNQTITGGLSVGIGRFYSIASEVNDLASYMRSSQSLLKNGTAVIATLGLCLIIGLLGLGYSQWIGLALAALVLSIFSGYNNALNNIQNAARQRAVVSLHTGADAWLKIGLVVVVMLWLGTSSTVVVIGYACSSFFITMSQFLFLRQTIQPTLSLTHNILEWKKQIWKYSLPFCTFGVFTWMQQVSDRWALQIYSTEAEVGQYAVLFHLGFTPIALVNGLLTSFIAPILYHRSGDASDHSRNENVHQLSWRMTQLLIVITLLAVLLAFALHKWVFNLLVAPAYYSISYLLPWVVLAGGLFAAGQMLSLKFMSEMKSSKLTLIKITTALIGVLCNLVGAAFMGMQGVVIGLVVCSAIYLLWMAVVAQNNKSTKSLSTFNPP